MTQAPRICLIEDDEIMGESLAERFGLEGLGCDWYRLAMTGSPRCANTITPSSSAISACRISPATPCSASCWTIR